jgi:hypothetical protein
MEKIPTIFVRDKNNGGKITETVYEGCEWVFAGEGTATEKIDGTNVRLTIRSNTCVRLEKRCNPTKVQKAKGVIEPWYTDADQNDPADKYIYAAIEGTDLSEWPDGEHCAEAIGPSIQGNPLGLERHTLVPFNLKIPSFDNVPRSFEGLKYFLSVCDSKYSPGHPIEGIVFHHQDGRRAKIKRKDFLVDTRK